MIEYTDDKFGIIKVLNVTEARAHFAMVLGDNHSHYVITKNNKPMRVIIGYSDYEKLKQQLGPEFVASIQDASLSYPGQRAESAQAELDRKQQKAKSRVPGILESNIALSYGLPDKRQRTMPTIKDEQPTRPQAYTVTTAPAPENQTPKFSEPTHADYFSSASIDSDDTSEYLASPEDAHAAPLDAAVSTNTPVQPMASEQSQNIHEALQQALDANAKAKKASAAFSARQTLEEPPLVNKPREPAAEAKKDPEQDEYFRKYKKLYERFETPQAQQATGPEAQDPEQLTFDNNDIEGELEAYPETETKRVNSAEESNEYFGQAEQGDAPSEIVRTKQQASPTVPVAPSQQKTPQRGAPELPSLKDLLASLDEEKLSGEEGEVDEADIENLIQRIQED